MVPQIPKSSGENVFCRQCKCSFKSTLQSNLLYFKRDNYVKHLIRGHMRKENVVEDGQTTLDKLAVKATYITFRKDLLKNIIYKYMPFSSVDYPFTVSSFRYLGYDPLLWN